MGWLDSNGLKKVWDNVKAALAEKQDKLVGAAGQVVGFDAAGNAVAQSTDSLVGPQGPKGEKGDTGATGETGAKGDKGDPGLLYGTCSTAPSTAAKVVALSGFALTTGAVVVVKFSNANTASSPTLNVNGTGAKYIKKYGTTAPDTYMWQAGAVVEFVYDGTYWIMLNGTVATTTYYGLTKLSNNISSDTGLAATPSAVKQAYDLAAAAPTKAYVDGLIREIKHFIPEVPDKIACLVIPTTGGVEERDYLKLELFRTSDMDYSLTCSGTIPLNLNGDITLEPPIGYAFTGLANTWQPALRLSNNKILYGNLLENGSIKFSVSSTSDKGVSYEFISTGNGSAPARFILEVA